MGREIEEIILEEDLLKQWTEEGFDILNSSGDVDREEVEALADALGYEEYRLDGIGQYNRERIYIK